MHATFDNSPPADSDLSRIAWIVVPAFNEAERIGRTLGQLCELYHHVVVVDDGSTDNTLDVLSNYAVWSLRHLVNCGQGASLQTGIRFAIGQGASLIVTFDADGQHRVEDIAPLCRPILEGKADIVLGSRFLGQAQGIPWTRWLTLKLGVMFTRVVSRVRVTDTHNGLRAMTAEAAGRIRILHNRMAHASEIIDEIRRNDLRYCEVPVTVRYWAGALRKGQRSLNGLRIVGQVILGKITR